MADQRCKRCGESRSNFSHGYVNAENYHPFEPEDAAPAPKEVCTDTTHTADCKKTGECDVGDEAGARVAGASHVHHGFPRHITKEGKGVWDKNCPECAAALEPVAQPGAGGERNPSFTREQLLKVRRELVGAAASWKELTETDARNLLFWLDRQLGHKTPEPEPAAGQGAEPDAVSICSVLNSWISRFDTSNAGLPRGTAQQWRLSGESYPVDAEITFWTDERVEKFAAHVTKGLEARAECGARKAGTAGGNYPQDCDWPFCGCDEKSSRVIEALIECGWKSAKEAREADELLQEARAQRDWLEQKCGEVGVQVNVHIGAPLKQAYGLVNQRAEAAEARNLELTGELERARSVPRIELFQKDWMPGFAAFLDDGAIQEGAPAHIALNLASFLGTIQIGEVGKEDLPYVIAESIMHEVMHVLESWAGAEFSEDRVEALLTAYRDKYAPEKPYYQKCEPRETPETQAFGSHDEMADLGNELFAAKETIKQQARELLHLDSARVLLIEQRESLESRLAEAEKALQALREGK